MGDEAAFLAAMRADPASRLTRHVYSDWLEERGDPRHELVRVCEAMRTVPVWSDDYWAWKARRNELWTRFPIGWLEATGYDGSDYDPLFRDGVPNGVRERWRLIREFTERWHGVSVPDVGGRRDVIAREEARLGLTLPESVRELIAFSHELGDESKGGRGGISLESIFLCSFYQLDQLNSLPAVSLINDTLDDGVTGVALADFSEPDPPAYFYNRNYRNGSIAYSVDPRRSHSRLTHSVFRNLVVNLPSFGIVHTLEHFGGELTTPLAIDASFCCRFDKVDIYELFEMIVFGFPPDPQSDSKRCVVAMVRRPVPVKSVPHYLIRPKGADTLSGGMLRPEHFQSLSLGEPSPVDDYPAAQWVSVLRRAEAARSAAPREPGA